MAELVLITSQRELEELASETVRRLRGQVDVDLQLPEVRLPALMSLYLTRVGMGPSLRLALMPVVCNRYEAKRIVYPKTNRRRSFGRDLKFIGSERLELKLREYMRSVERSMRALGRNLADTPLQRELINEAMNCVRDRGEPLLVTYRTATPMDDGTKVIDFFILLPTQARRLVYYKKNKNKLRKQLAPRNRLVQDNDFKYKIEGFLRSYHHKNKESF